jgi:hypothetical protein
MASGLAASLLAEKYQDPPNEEDSLLNGHVLHLFIASSSRNATKCAVVLLTLLRPESCSDKRLIETVRSKIAALVAKSLKKFKRLTSASESAKFLALCSSPFALPTPNSASRPASVTKPPVFCPVPAPSPVKTRQLQKCARCTNLRRRIVGCENKMIERLRARIRRLQLLRPTCVRNKVLVQKVKRRDRTIEEMKSTRKTRPTIKEPHCGEAGRP